MRHRKALFEKYTLYSSFSRKIIAKNLFLLYCIRPGRNTTGLLNLTELIENHLLFVLLQASFVEWRQSQGSRGIYGVCSVVTFKLQRIMCSKLDKEKA